MPLWTRLVYPPVSFQCCWLCTVAFAVWTWNRNSVNENGSDKMTAWIIYWRENQYHPNKINSQHLIRCTLYVFRLVHLCHCWWCSSFSIQCKCCLPSAPQVSVLHSLDPWYGRLFFSIFPIAVIATVALAFLLLPMCQYIIRPCSDGSRISFGFCGRFTTAELFSFSLALSIVCIWVLTGHWLLMDGKNGSSIHRHKPKKKKRKTLTKFLFRSNGHGTLCCIYCIRSIA